MKDLIEAIAYIFETDPSYVKFSLFWLAVIVILFACVVTL